MLAVLAPVPDIHLRDAIAICEKHGRVAFGSNAWEFFKTLDDEIGIQGLPILIFASRTGAGDDFKFYNPGRVPFTAQLDRWFLAPTGRHPDPQLRPELAHKDDTRWAEFWDVTKLRFHKPLKQILLSDLKTVRSGKPGASISKSPEGPQKVILGKKSQAILAA